MCSNISQPLDLSLSTPIDEFYFLLSSIWNDFCVLALASTANKYYFIPFLFQRLTRMNVSKTMTGKVNVNSLFFDTSFVFISFQISEKHARQISHMVATHFLNVLPKTLIIIWIFDYMSSWAVQWNDSEESQISSLLPLQSFWWCVFCFRYRRGLNGRRSQMKFVWVLKMGK